MSFATAYWCVLATAVLPYVWAVLAKSSGHGRVDNHDPRGWLARQDSPRVQRANAAQSNAFEAFAPFAAAVILSQLAGVPSDRVAVLALAFVALRVLHGVFYVADLASLRSLAWIGGFGCVLVLLAQAAMAQAGA